MSEQKTIIFENDKMRVERIHNVWHSSPNDFWYDQDEDEWVTLLEGQAELEYTNGRRITLMRGDCLLIPAHCRHRVVYTDSHCIWLVVFVKKSTYK